MLTHLLVLCVSVCQGITLPCCPTDQEPADFEDSNGRVLNSTAVCLFWLNEAQVVEAARISSIQATLNNRLAVAATAGDSALAEAITALQASSPEVAVVILADTGADPINYPYLVRVDVTALWCFIILSG